MIRALIYNRSTRFVGINPSYKRLACYRSESSIKRFRVCWKIARDDAHPDRSYTGSRSEIVEMTGSRAWVNGSDESEVQPRCQSGMPDTPISTRTTRPPHGNGRLEASPLPITLSRQPFSRGPPRFVDQLCSRFHDAGDQSQRTAPVRSGVDPLDGNLTGYGSA